MYIKLKIISHLQAQKCLFCYNYNIYHIYGNALSLPNHPP